MQMEEIVKKVLEEIRKLESERRDRKKMLVIGEALSAKEDQLKRKYEAHYELEFASCFDEQADFDLLLLAEISPTTLQKLAMGMNPSIGPVMEALILGKDVRYLPEGLFHRSHEKTCPRLLYGLYEDAVKKIASLGIHPEAERSRKGPGEVKETGKKRRGLLGEKEIQGMVEKGEKILYVEEAPIITPLAKDLMRNHGITVEKRERRE